MKKGIIIVVLITLSLILFKPPKIKATNLSNWAEGLPVLSRIDYKSCNSSSCTTDISTIDLPYLTSNGDRQAVYNSTDFDVGKNGYNIVIQSPNMKPGYLYETNFYYCTYSNITNDLDMISAYIGSHSQYTDNSIYNNTTTIQIGNIPGNEDLGFSRCYRTVSLNVPQYQSNNNWYNYRLRKESGVFYDLRLVAISYEVNELGIYTSEIEKIIEDSGLASAESVTQVQESVNKVEEAITGDYDYNDTPSEELEGKEEIDNLKNKEEELLENLDFSGAEDIEITIEPESASFIWQIVDSLRSMSGKIVLLITSILGLGIIKMILNR